MCDKCHQLSKEKDYTVECTYQTFQRVSATQALEDKISRLEARLDEVSRSRMSDYMPAQYDVSSRNIHGSPSGSPRASSLGGVSDAGGESPGSPASNTPTEWNLPSYDLPTHQLMLNGLVRLGGLCSALSG